MTADIPPETPPGTLATGGGAVVQGDVNTSRDFVGRDKIIYGDEITNLGDQQYDVRGLPNPYLGLSSFAYKDRAIYAGRQSSVSGAVRALTAPGAHRTLLFVTGASGSGKSSFVQAGMLPALEAHYQARDINMRWAVVRPSLFPLAGLTDGLLQLGLPLLDVQATMDDPGMLLRHVQQYTPAQQVNVLIIDQFEELFTQSDITQRDTLFRFLQVLPSFNELHTHIIATLRSDYLPELFEQKALYDIAKQGIDLRAMTSGDLREAIQQPLHHLLMQQGRPLDEKRFEDALLEKLADDAAEDAAYLPLLQVTLQDLWQRGWLKLAAYGSLASAIRGRAEHVYNYVDIDGQEQPRAEADRSTIVQIFLDLVEVSLDNDSRHDVRRRRRVSAVAQTSPDRARLIEDLSSARLLSRTVEKAGDGSVEIDVVDIIHESLIRNWDRLRAAIAEQRQILQQRRRFELALQEWLAHDRAADYLLSGIRLAEAEALNDRGSVALQNVDAQQLLALSIARHEEERQRELALARERVEEQTRAAKRLRRLAFVLALVMILAGGAAFYGQQQAQYATDQAATAVAA